MALPGGSAAAQIAGLAAICAMHGAVAFGQASASADRTVLEAFYDATGGDWRDDTNWKTAVPLGEWYGVTTNSVGRVTRLDLAGNGLAGSMPTALGRLAKLEVLNLNNNDLTGPIPGTLENLVGLEELNLAGNALTGPIPAGLGRLANLKELFLHLNDLTGPIPVALGNLVKLQRLYLSTNELTGPIPRVLGRLVNLEALDLQGNALRGSIAPNPTTPGREGQINIGDRRIAVIQGMSALTRHRDRLLLDWAGRRDKGSVCEAWDALVDGEKEVFIWNTHRLHISDMLTHVTKLYSITGRNGQECGGAGYNRTYMSMSSALNERLIATALRDTNGLTRWRPTRDALCVIRDATAFPLNCPHTPFWYQVETRGNGPTGQIQFFQAGLVTVRRTHYSGTGRTPDGTLTFHPHGCGVQRLNVRPAEVCRDDSCSQSIDPVGLCTVNTSYRDEEIGAPDYPSYSLPKDNDFIINDEYSFEMDHDYSSHLGVITLCLLGHCHSSAPVCNDGRTDMRLTYQGNYGNPDWQWAPSRCQTGRAPEAPFTDSALSRQTNGIRAVYIEEVRARIDGLRNTYGLPPAVWTDGAIVPGATLVKAVHVQELRSALEEAYVASGRAVPAYTDDPLEAGVSRVSPVHLAEVRTAIVALEQPES